MQELREESMDRREPDTPSLDGRKYHPPVYCPDPVAMGMADDDDLIHRVVIGRVQPVGTPLGKGASESVDFQTACGLRLHGEAVHGIMNNVECLACWEVPLRSYDPGHIQDQIIGRRRAF